MICIVTENRYLLAVNRSLSVGKVIVEGADKEDKQTEVTVGLAKTWDWFIVIKEGAQLQNKNNR